MTAGAPWSIKGIDNEARELAKEAARKQGLTLGQWLTAMIRQSAAGTIEPAQGVPARNVTAIEEKLEQLEQRLSQLTREQQQTAAARFYNEQTTIPAEALLARLDRHERRTVEAFAALNDRLSGLVRSNMSAGHPTELPAPLESALRQIIEHTAASEQRNRAALQEMQERLAALSEQASSALAAGGVRNSPTLEAVERRFAALAERIAQTERSIEQLSAAAPAASASDDWRGELARSEERLTRLIDEIRAQAAGQDHSPLYEQIDLLARRLQAMEQSQAGNDAESQLHDLAARIEALDQRLTQAIEDQLGVDILVELQTHIVALTAKLETVEKRFDDIDAIERSVAELFHAMEASKAEAASRGADTGPSPELQALQNGLLAVRKSLTEAEGQTKSTLSVVQETLEKIIERLTQVEQRLDRQPEVPESPVVTEAAEQGATPPPDLSRAAEIPEVLRNMRVPAEPLATTTPAPHETSAPSAGEAALHAAIEPPIDTITRRDDFIAAARRAALAAAQSPNPQPRRFSALDRLRVFGRGKSADDDHSDDDTPTVSHRKPLILAGALVLLLAISAYGTVTGHRGTQTAATATKTNAVTAEKGKPATDEKSWTIANIGEWLQKFVGRNGQATDIPSIEGDPIATGSIKKTTPAPDARPAPAPADPAAPAASADSAPGKRSDALPLPGSSSPAYKGAAALADTLPERVGPEELRQAAMEGDQRAQFVVATRLLEGDGPSEPQAALRWFLKAAGQGHAPAQYRVGVMYERGTGMPANLAMARAWYQRAAEKGNVKAMHNLAVALASDETSAPDYAAAAKWFAAAAAYGIRDSQFNYGVLLEKGLGVPANLEEAYFWLALCGRAGDREASDRAQQIARQLAGDRSKALDERVAAWRPKQPLQEANVVTIEPRWQDLPKPLPGQRAELSRIRS
jgi:localization factor PodJL